MSRHTAADRRKRGSGHPAGFAAATRMGFLVHELRNALACVFAAQAMIKRAPGDESATALLERNLRHMRLMLDRADSEVRLHREPPARPRPLPVSEAVAEVAASASEEARRKGVTFSVRVDPGLTVSADEEFLASALTNLVQNAIKFTPAGGSVEVRGQAKGDSAVLEVEDRCGGLPPGRIAELFEPFTQRGADRSGLGLGLAISRRAVALNNGVLGARDIPGKGCVFTITLPLAVTARSQ